MASSESKRLTIVDKFNGKNFSLYRFKSEMVLATKDLWKIVDSSKLRPPSMANDNNKKAYEQ